MAQTVNSTRGKSHAAGLLELLAIEGDLADNQDGAFAKLGTGASPLLDFATPNQVLTTIALHRRGNGPREGRNSSPKNTCRAVKRNERKFRHR